VFTRLAGRLVTSPVAFVVAGVLDAVAFWIGWVRQRLR